MQIKVQCPCGARYSFEVEPVNGRMPMPVNCPACGADGTVLANAAIQAQLAVAPDLPPVPPPVDAPGQGARLRIHRAPAPQAPTAEAPSVEHCAKHPREPAVETCRVCGKPMCAKCMELLGYVCSIYCRNQAESQGIDLPVYKHQRSVVEQRFFGRVKWIAVACSLVIVALAGAWFWYSFFGSHPRVVFTESIPKEDASTFYALLPPHELLSIQQGQITLFDAAKHKQVWSSPLGGAATGSTATNGFSANELDSEIAPRVVITTNDIWVLRPDVIFRYDRKTGRQQQSVPLHPPATQLSRTDHAIFAISDESPGEETITRVALPEGTVHEDRIKPEVPKVARAQAQGRVMRAGVGSPAATGKGTTSAEQQFYADGAGVLQVGVRLLEYKVISRQAMKPKGKSLLNNNLTAADSMMASEQVLNDMRRQRTGGTVKENVSRYQVTLQRLPAQGAPSWTGEVIGPPSFYPLQTVDVLAGGSSITVFDKRCKKLWESKLTYSLLHQSAGDADDAGEDSAAAPCLEAGNTLYVFDQGMLNAFDLLTGKVRWRLTSVGISRVQVDRQGMLYVDTTSASADKIQFAQQIDIFNKTEPVILKVDPATGKVLWRTKGVAKQCYLSGKFLYAALSSTDPMSALNPSEDHKVFYNLYRLNPSNGHVMWDYFQPQWPVKCQVQGKWILLQFPGKLQVLTFLNL